MSESGKLPVVDQAWLARRTEEILGPDLPIIDAHHHIWEMPGFEYRLDDFLADLESGHRIEQTVFVQCGYAYRGDGPEALRPVGETERIAALAEEAAQRGTMGICAGIVGHADLTLGEEVTAVLEAHIEAAKGRFRGIRHALARSDALKRHLMPPPPEKLAFDPVFRRGFALLSRFGLSFDAWLFHPQLPELVDLARAFPDTPIVVNHLGGPMGIGPYKDRQAEVFATWRSSIRELAHCPNVHIKLGGFGLSVSGRDFHLAPLPPSSGELAAAWRPYVETCIEAFGAERCMFESNFPVDKSACSWPVLWNTCKRLAAAASAEERANLFHHTAARFYRLT